MSRRHDSPDSSVHSNHAPVLRVEHNDHSNKTMTIIALILASALLGGFGVYVLMAERAESLRVQLADANVRAGVAQAETIAARARTDSRVALDEIERMRTSLAAKGIVVTKDHD